MPLERFVRGNQTLRRALRRAGPADGTGCPRSAMQAIVTLAGEGTRMLPWSRGLRKEFLPLYDRGSNGAPVLKPVAHLVVESLVRAGADRLAIVVQPRDETTVRNYFSVDPEFLARHRHHAERLTETTRFYAAIGGVSFSYPVQPRPRGFGDAVLRARAVVGSRPFLLHAGDGLLLGPGRDAVLRALFACRERDDADAVLLVRRVRDPRHYGVVEGRSAPPFRGFRRLAVTGIAEKPERPRSSWAATATYAFSAGVFRALARSRRSDRPTELELTDGIRALLAEGRRVTALVLDRHGVEWRSVGSPDGYARALARTRSLARRPPVVGND